MNHYYSHLVGQCCCQQHEMMVRKGETKVQSSITSQSAKTYKMSKNLQKPQQFSEIKACTSIVQPSTYDAKNEQGTRTLQGEIRSHVVEPQLQFAQASVPNQMNTMPLYAVDTTVPPPVTTKKEREESQTHVVDNTKVQQKDGELLKVVQMVAESLQQQIVLGMQTADMSQQCTDALIGELIKSHNRKDMDHILNNIPTFNGLEPEKCVDWVMRITNACEQSNRDFRQELKNKLELIVQNFIKGLGTDISDDKIMNRILVFFSNIPNNYHAMDKIKSIKQNDEPMPQFNQKYRTYIKRLERKAVHEMTSHTQMELYMSAINPHIAKALRTNIYYGSRYTATSVGDAMKKAEECYLKDLDMRAGLEKDREQGNADREVTCVEVNTRGRNQWQSSGEKQGSWTSQEYQENRNKPGYLRPYDRWDREDNTETRMYRNTTENSRNADTKKMYNKQSESSENSQRSWPAAVARGGYTQIVVNPMQLEDEAFTAWIQRLTESRQNRENRVQRLYRNFRKPYNDKYEPSKESGRDRYRKYQIKQKFKPVTEIEVQPIMEAYRCTYKDVEEAIDLFNLDFEECNQA